MYRFNCICHVSHGNSTSWIYDVFQYIYTDFIVSYCIDIWFLSFLQYKFLCMLACSIVFGYWILLPRLFMFLHRPAVSLPLTPSTHTRTLFPSLPAEFIGIARERFCFSSVRIRLAIFLLLLFIFFLLKYYKYMFNYFSTNVVFSSAINLYCFQNFFCVRIDFDGCFCTMAVFFLLNFFLSSRFFSCFIICLTLFVFTYAYNVWYFAAVTDYDRLTDIGHNAE